ncbi:MAG: FAD:protein FMN transferase [Tissierellia bacterium]|nr:FAD:protein FMN transferase [Tissierellia bacterium]
MRRVFAALLAIALLLAGCGNQKVDPDAKIGSSNEKREKYEYVFYNTFDTVISFVAYMNSQKAFDEQAAFVESEFQRLHKIFDNYQNYDGVSNVKTLNDNAGKDPIVVDKELIDLIQLSRDYTKKYSDKTNIALGAVLGIWHQYREEGLANPQEAKIPTLEELNEAAQHVNLNDVKIDSKKSTVQLVDPLMSLDLGAVAKGYATELVAKALLERGVDSAIVSAGGNVRTIGQPKDGLRNRWGIGIQNPDNAMGKSGEQTIEVLYVKGTSVVTSGDYQRYYTVDGKTYHHLIDPVEKMPMTYFRSVSVVTEDSGLADFLSTAAFLMPFEESKKFIEGLDGVEAIWILNDNTITATENLKKEMRSEGATSKDE